MRYQAAIVISVFILGGCSAFDRKKINYENPTRLGSSLTYSYECKEALVTKCPPNYFKNAIIQAKDKKAERNRVLFELLGIVDDEYARFEITLRSDRTFKDILVTIVSLGLTGTATLASEGTAHTLAAIDTGLKGANAAVDSNAFRDKAPELIINTMRSNRSKVLKEIYQSMANDETKYPLEAAIRDVIRYYNEGSVTSALVSLLSDSADEQKKAKDGADAAKILLLSQ